MSLETLAADLKLVLMDEASPKNWTGGLAPISELTKTERADRALEKKDATATAVLLTKINQLLELENALPKGQKTKAEQQEADELAQQIKDAEKAAADLVKRLGVASLN